MTLPPDLPWRRGMTAILPDGTRALVTAAGEGWIETEIHPGCVSTTDLRPDPNDGATLGALLAEVREAYRDPLAHAWPTEDQEGLEPTRWYVRVPAVYGSRAIGRGDTEFNALLAAWNARPRSP